MNASPRSCTPDQLGCDFGPDLGANWHVFLSMTEPCCGSNLACVERHPSHKIVCGKLCAWNLVNTALAILTAPATCRRTEG